MRLSRTTTRVLLICIPLWVPACISKPSEQELANADYGEFPENYQEIATGYIGAGLKDPYSAVYEWQGAPRRAWHAFARPKFGWALCFRVNAKNSYGGFTGSKLYYVMIRDDRVKKMFGGDGDYSQAVARGACDSLY